MKLLPIAAPLAAILLLAACQKDYGPTPGLGDPYPAPLNDPQITLLSPELQPWIRFQPARIERSEDRPMYVEVPCRNLTEKTYDIDYRFVFYDAYDFEIEPTMGWALATLANKQTVRLRANAMSTDAVRYRLEVRWAQ